MIYNARSTTRHSCRSFSTSQLRELKSRQFGRTPSTSQSLQQGSLVSKAAPTALYRGFDRQQRFWSSSSSPPSWRSWKLNPSQHGFKPSHSTSSAMLPISARVGSGFNQRKLPSRIIAIAVDISKAFGTVSHRLFIEMIHLS